VNRKEMGYAVAGMLGTIAGAGCANPERSTAALPPASQELRADFTGPALRPTFLTVVLRSVNAFTKNPGTVASSSDPTVCRISETPDKLDLYAAKAGTSIITLRDVATGSEAKFHIVVGA
jgi:hypothetical protein